MFNKAYTPLGEVIYSPTLDDRLGVYIILELLPKLGVTCDWLLTNYEESGNSTASQFSAYKQYNWMFSFDRKGYDVVTYQYQDRKLKKLLNKHGFIVASGSYSDISSLEHLGCKGMNFGCGYHEYHSPNAYAVMSQLIYQVTLFVRFYNSIKNTQLRHVKEYDKYTYLFQGKNKF